MIKEKGLYKIAHDSTVKDATIVWCDTITKNDNVFHVRMLITREIYKQVYWKKMIVNTLSIFENCMYDNPERLLIERVFRYRFIQTGE